MEFVDLKPPIEVQMVSLDVVSCSLDHKWLEIESLFHAMGQKEGAEQRRKEHCEPNSLRCLHGKQAGAMLIIATIPAIHWDLWEY